MCFWVDAKLLCFGTWLGYQQRRCLHRGALGSDVYHDDVAGWIADSLIARNWDITTVRKLMQSIGLLGSAFFLFITHTVTTPDMALLSLSGALGLLAFAYSGSAPNVLDIAPRFGGVLFGVMNTLELPGIIVATAGWLVDATGLYDSVCCCLGGGQRRRRNGCYSDGHREALSIRQPASQSND